MEASYQRQRASPPRRRLTVTSAVPNAAAGSRRLLEVASGPTNRIQTIEHRVFIRSLRNRSLLRRSKLELDGVSRSNDKISPNLVGPYRLPLESLMCTFHPVLCRLLAFATVNIGLASCVTQQRRECRLLHHQRTPRSLTKWPVGFGSNIYSKPTRRKHRSSARQPRPADHSNPHASRLLLTTKQVC